MIDVSSTNLLLLLRDNHIISDRQCQLIKVCQLSLQFCVAFAMLGYYYAISVIHKFIGITLVSVIVIKIVNCMLTGMINCVL